MWKVAVLLLVIQLLELISAGIQPTDVSLVQRLKRSPGYYEHYHHWPPPPPPDYWPPPPRFWPRLPPLPPPPPEQQLSSECSNVPCNDNCGVNPSARTAVSNARSKTGEAIAIAVSKGE